MRGIEGLLLDLDDTLIDEARASEIAFRALVAEHDTRRVSVPFGHRLREWRRLSRLHWTRFEAGELDFQQQRRCRVRDYLGSDLDDAAADTAFRSFERAYEDAWSRLPGVSDFLEATERIPKVVVTNGDDAMQRRKVAATGLLEHVVAVITPATCGEWKPHPGPFRAALEALGCDGSRCLMIGDDETRDIAPARKLGLQTLRVRPGVRILDALAEPD